MDDSLNSSDRAALLAAAGEVKRNRSFVVRAARMSPAQRRWYEAARGGTLLLPEDLRRESFAHRTEGASRIALDVGFGNGESLLEQARANPDWFFIGVDVHRPGIGRLCGALTAAEVRNALVIEADAVDVIAEWVPRGGVDLVQLLFPDPWPKKRHEKRRIVRPAAMALFAWALRPGGVLRIATDWAPYAEQIESVLDAAPPFERCERATPEIPQRPETAFERKGLDKGHTIFEFEFRRSVSDHSASPRDD